MRLWHKQLIAVLPRQQLISQWRELCCIAKNINQNGTPNHILVNKILDYNKQHLICYSKLILNEMKQRKYKISEKSFKKFLNNLETNKRDFDNCYVTFDELFQNWHNQRYLKQCYYNLEEKYDCGGITTYEFLKIKKVLDI